MLARRFLATHHQEAGKIVRGVLNAGDEDLHPVRLGRACSGDGPAIARAASGQLFDRSSRIIRRYRLSASANEWMKRVHWAKAGGCDAM